MNHIQIGLVYPSGVGKLVVSELKFRKISFLNERHIQLRNQQVLLIEVLETDYKKLFLLRTVEDIFYVYLTDYDLYHVTHLKTLVPNNLKDRILSSLQYLPTKKRKNSTNYFIFIKQDEDRGIYRAEIANRIAGYIDANFQKWIMREPADVELWGFYYLNKFTLALRLTDIDFRKRNYKISDMPGSLKPVIGASLCMASYPTPTDVVFDPMCGSGTVIIERGLFGKFNSLTCSDIDSKCYERTSENLSKANVPCTVYNFNSTEHDEVKNLGTGQYDKIIVNLPFGKKFNSDINLLKLYEKALEAWSELLSEEGLIVVLTSRIRDIKTAAKRNNLSIKEVCQVNVQGINSGIFQLRKI